MANVAKKAKKKVLVVGLYCVDVVNYVDKYPAEDSDTRVMEQRTCLGGNAANNATVLVQLGGREACELWAALPEGNTVLDSLITRCGIDVGRSMRRPDAEVPVSTVIVNRVSGSRTILHYRGSLPELSFAEFADAFRASTSASEDGLGPFGWVHFEGRNFDQVRRMMDFVRALRVSSSSASDFPRISVELEKVRPQPLLEQLIPLADVILVSKDFAKAKGWNSAESAIDAIQRQFEVPNTPVICTWGEKGASARASLRSPLLVRPPFPLNRPVVDTLGAGDCFIGTALYHLNRGEQLAKVLEEAVRVAGRKCTRKGMTDVGEAEAEEAEGEGR